MKSAGVGVVHHSIPRSPPGTACRTLLATTKLPWPAISQPSRFCALNRLRGGSPGLGARGTRWLASRRPRAMLVSIGLGEPTVGCRVGLSGDAWEAAWKRAWGAEREGAG